MNNNYEIDLTFNRDQDELEEFEIADNNLATVQVDPRGKKPNGEMRYIVYLKMTADGMLGLGTELVRKALYDKKNHLTEGLSHLYQTGKEDLVQAFGIHLTPDSSELIIERVEMETVEEMYKKVMG